MKGKNKHEAAKVTAMIPLPVHSAATNNLNKLGGRNANRSFQWLIETLIGEWVAGDRKIESIPPPRYQGDIDNLRRIMDYGPPSKQKLVQALLKEYSDGLQNPSQPGSTPKPKTKAG